MEGLNSDLVRTFIAVADAGSITVGAARIHRLQSATSLQLKRPESILGKTVFERHGRGGVLSETGRRLLPVAHEVTVRLDSVLRDISQDMVTDRNLDEPAGHFLAHCNLSLRAS